jgi:hypothetical protein
MKESSLGPARILLPTVPLGQWSVIACDQFTSRPDYWREAAAAAGDGPSTLGMICPEYRLLEGNPPEPAGVAAEIRRAMEAALEGGALRPAAGGMIYLERTLPSGKVRKGLMAALDLESYDWRPGARTPVRATEEVVEERIPMRLAIRREAPLELPHAMMLMDDRGRTVLEPLSAAIGEMDLEYTGSLMLGGGSVRGWSLSPEQQESVLEALGRLAERSPMELGVGDGNHSLAAARRYWEEVRRELPEDRWEDCPARYALVEVVNLWDPALEFEPVHRVVTGVSPDCLLEDLELELGAGLLPREGAQELRYVTLGMEGRLWVPNPASPLAARTLQGFLDRYCRENPECRVDYIHGEEELRRLAEQEDAVGFLMPPIPKEDLFPMVLSGGPLPRKTFSMGQARDKRYYLECRFLRP